MNKVIEKFYKIYLDEEAFLVSMVDKEKAKEEWELYNVLYENLSEEHKKELLKYIHLRGDREKEELKEAFVRGFKTAVRLWAEALKE